MTNLIEDRPQADHGEAFELMAARIRKNADEGFAGAFVVVSPDGEIISNLFLNSAKDIAMFWANLKMVAESAIDEVTRKQVASQQRGW